MLCAFFSLWSVRELVGELAAKGKGGVEGWNDANRFAGTSRSTTVSSRRTRLAGRRVRSSRRPHDTFSTSSTRGHESKLSHFDSLDCTASNFNKFLHPLPLPPAVLRRVRKSVIASYAEQRTIAFTRRYLVIQDCSTRCTIYISIIISRCPDFA